MNPAGLGKIPKDLAQAELLIGILSEDRPQELANARHVAVQNGPEWRAGMKDMLEKII